MDVSKKEEKKAEPAKPRGFADILDDDDDDDDDLDVSDFPKS